MCENRGSDIIRSAIVGWFALANATHGGVGEPDLDSSQPGGGGLQSLAALVNGPVTFPPWSSPICGGDEMIS